MTYMIQRQEKTARARAENVTVSSKQCIEICSFLRGKPLDHAITLLEGVLEKTQAVPFRRFTNGLGHRKGMAAGRYPIKAASEVLVLLENVKSNAATQGLTGNLKIVHLAANRASRPVRNRLKYRGEFKRTHLEVVVAEAPEQKKASAKKTPTASSKKTEPKVEEKKPEPKAEEKKEEPETAPEKKEKPKVEEKTAQKPEETKEVVEAPSKEVEKTPEKQPPAKEEPTVKEVMDKIDEASMKKAQEKKEEKKDGD